LEAEGKYLKSEKPSPLWTKPIRYLSKQINYIIVLVIIALFYLIIILLYTHGSLLFDGDNYGFYHLTRSLFTTPTGILEGISLFITGSNVYVAFYVYVFLSLIIALMSIFYFSVQFFKYFLPSKYVRIAALVSSFLYVITPYILVDYYNTFLGNISIPASFFTLFLAFMIGSYQFYKSEPKRFLAMYSFGGFFLGLSVTLFPNDIRTLFVGFVLFLVFFIFTVTRIWYATRRADLSLAIIAGALFIVVSIVASFFITLPMFINIGSTVHSASVAASNFTSLEFYTGAFNTIPWTIRLLGEWTFPTGYVTYHSVYFNFDIVNIASFFWPILVLFVPLVIAYRNMRNRALFLLIMALVVFAIFWEKGGNAPFGSVWYFINSKLPFGYELIPTGTLTVDYLSKVYPVLAVLSIFLIFEYLRNWSFKGLHRSYRKIALIAVPIFLAAMLVVAEAPLFDGQLEANYYKPNTSGFFIPQEYSEIRSYVLDHPGNVLILPGATTYVTFSWNYSGTTYFYNQFFYPANVTTNQNFGGGYGSPQQISAYVNITSPILYDNGATTISSNWLNEIKADNYTYLLFDKSIIGGSLYENYTYTYDAIHCLVDNHIIEPVFNGTVLNLYLILGRNL
jgi:hypothetical protein